MVVPLQLRELAALGQCADGVLEVFADLADPQTQNEGTAILKVSVHGTREVAGRAFSSRMVELALSGYPGLYHIHPPQAGSAFGLYWPGLLDQRQVNHRIVHHDGRTETIPLADHPREEVGRGVATDRSPAGSAEWSAELIEVPHADIV